MIEFRHSCHASWASWQPHWNAGCPTTSLGSGGSCSEVRADLFNSSARKQERRVEINDVLLRRAWDP